MILTLALAGLYLLLWLPFVGHWVSHGILHYIVHKSEHSETFMVCFSLSLVALVLSIPVLLVFSLFFPALDAFLLLLILHKLLTCSQH